MKRRKQNEEKRILLREERQIEINRRNVEKETEDNAEIGDENLEKEEVITMKIVLLKTNSMNLMAKITVQFS